MKSKNSMVRRMLASVLGCAMLTTTILIPGEAGAASKKAVKSIEMVKPSGTTLALKKGETFLIKVKVKPVAATKNIAFQSSKKKVVSVNKNGKLKALKNGSAVITIASKSKPKKSVKIKVTVRKKLTKVKSVALNHKQASLLIGQTIALKSKVLPKNATVKNVEYRSGDTSIATVGKTGLVTAKKVGKATIYAYAKDGRGAVARCKISVTEPTLQTTVATPSQNTAASTPESTVTPTETERPIITLADETKTLSVYVDDAGEDYEGIGLAADSFADDVEKVLNSENRPEVQIDLSAVQGTALYVGSIGNNAAIDAMIANGKLDVSDISGKWETYKIQVIDQPFSGVEKGVFVVGSDKRGAIYGLYHISELIGVSPWVFWADAVPDRKDKIEFYYDELNMTSKEPSVRYRGIFLNDEAPSLTGWVQAKFKDYNENFYAHVYELILRCKGNYLWPAMWSNSFSEDGKSSKIANAELADKYGIVMGTSHHEPLCRAGIEWQNSYRKYGTSNSWNFNKNEEAITKFWEAGVERNKYFENVYTLGMRGEADSALSGTDEENIELLKKVITTQKKILQENDLSEAPKVLTVYKEVERFWHGTDQTPGLKKWNQLDDVIIMLCDDNFGNMRTLPEDDIIDRAGGWGMYYHFDYHGGPTSYEWVNTLELNKVWEQMTLAYEHGIDDIWIVNVGDLKPMEMNISYFLDLAYDYDTWGKNGLNRTEEYMNRWVRQQFGTELSETEVQDIRHLLQEYTWLNGSCKPEVIDSNTYNVTNYNEALNVLSRIQNMEELAEDYYSIVPEKQLAAYFELVYYPLMASANVAKMQICTGLNKYYYNKGSLLANVYASIVDGAIERDKALQKTYNTNIPGVKDKWKNMMSSPHVGYVTWDSTGWKYPTSQWLETTQASKLFVNVQNDPSLYQSGECQLPEFTNAANEKYRVTLSNAGRQSLNYTVTSSDDWICVTKNSGQFSVQDHFDVSVDWSKNPGTSGSIQIQCGSQIITLRVTTRTISVEGLIANTYVYANGYASILPGRFVQSGNGNNGTNVAVIQKYGKTGESIKALPTNAKIASVPEDAAWVEYQVSVQKAGNYRLTAYTAPSNNVLRDDIGIYFGLSVNGGKAQKINTVDANSYKGGEYSGSWTTDVEMNGRTTQKTIALKAGVNTIRIYAMDPAFVLQKLVVSENELEKSHLGPSESYYVGKTEADPEITWDLPDQLPEK